MVKSTVMFRPASRGLSSRNHIAGRYWITSMECHIQAFDQLLKWLLVALLKNIRQDICQCPKHYLTCQASNIHKQTRSPFSAFPLLDDRFHHIYVDDSIIRGFKVTESNEQWVPIKTFYYLKASNLRRHHFKLIEAQSIEYNFSFDIPTFVQVMAENRILLNT